MGGLQKIELINEKFKLIEHPDYKKLKDELQELKNKISEKLYEKDELIHRICPAIEQTYLLKLGPLEYKAYEFEIEYLRAKRKLELIQKQINRKETIKITEIEKQLEKEYEEYVQRLAEELEKLSQIYKDSQSQELLTPEEAKQLRKLYREIVKQLHPDLNKNLTPAEKNLFYSAVEAYEAGDVTTLKGIHNMLINIDSGEDEIISDEHLEDELKKLKKETLDLKKLLIQIQAKINEIKESHPYNKKELLNNEKELKAYEKGLEEVIIDYKNKYQEYRQAIKKILKTN